MSFFSRHKIILQEIKIFYVLFLILFSNISYSQQASVAGGGDLQVSGGGSMAFSIGQIVYTQIDNGILYVAQGVQQPYEVFINFVSELFDKNSVSIFPNPFENEININFQSLDFSNCKAKLIDLQGNVIQETILTDLNNQLYVGNLSRGGYFIILENNVGGIYTVKLIKN